MPLPKQIKVTGIPYKLKEHTKLTRGKVWPNSTRDHDDELWGACDTGQQMIHLDNGQAIDTFKQTLLHEVIHAMLDHTTYAQNADQENICEALTAPLYQLIRDNPKLIEYLQERK